MQSLPAQRTAGRRRSSEKTWLLASSLSTAPRETSSDLRGVSLQPPPAETAGREEPSSVLLRPVARWGSAESRPFTFDFTCMAAYPRRAHDTSPYRTHTWNKGGGRGAPLLPAPATRGSYLSPIFAIQLILHSALTGATPEFPRGVLCLFAM